MLKINATIQGETTLRIDQVPGLVQRLERELELSLPNLSVKSFRVFDEDNKLVGAFTKDGVNHHKVDS